MEGKLLYFTYLPFEEAWEFSSIPISQAYVDSTEPSGLSRYHLAPQEWNIADSLAKEVSKLCGKNGFMEGW